MNPEATVLIGRHFQAGNGNALHAGLVGAHEDRAGIRHDAQQLDRERRYHRALGLHDDRHAADNPVALRQDRKDAVAGRRLLDRRDVAEQSRNVTRKGVGSGPLTAKPVCSAASGSGRRTGVAEPPWPTTTRERWIASAKTSSLLGRLFSLLRVSSSRLRKLVTAMLGDIRSGSAKMTSNAIAAAPSWVSCVTRSATIVRGHGHWPMSFRLLSSISTIVTGRATVCRGRRL